MGVFVMTSSKIGPFCNDVIKNKKEKHFCVFFVDDVISVHICKDSAPILEKFLGLKSTNFDSLFLASLLRY